MNSNLALLWNSLLSLFPMLLQAGGFLLVFQMILAAITAVTMRQMKLARAFALLLLFGIVVSSSSSSVISFCIEARLPTPFYFSIVLIGFVLGLILTVLCPFSASIVGYTLKSPRRNLTLVLNVTLILALAVSTIAFGAYFWNTAYRDNLGTQNMVEGANFSSLLLFGAVSSLFAIVGTVVLFYLALKKPGAGAVTGADKPLSGATIPGVDDPTDGSTISALAPDTVSSESSSSSANSSEQPLSEGTKVEQTSTGDAKPETAQSEAEKPEKDWSQEAATPQEKIEDAQPVGTSAEAAKSEAAKPADGTEEKDWSREASESAETKLTNEERSESHGT